MSYCIKHLIQAKQSLAIAQDNQLRLPLRTFKVEDFFPEPAEKVRHHPLCGKQYLADCDCLVEGDSPGTYVAQLRASGHCDADILSKLIEEYITAGEPNNEQIQEAIDLLRKIDAEEVDWLRNAANDGDDGAAFLADLASVRGENADAVRAREITEMSKTHSETLTRLVAEVRRGNAAAIDELVCEVYAQGEEPAVNCPAAVRDLVERATKLANDPLSKVDWSLKPAGKNSDEWLSDQGLIDLSARL